LLVITVYATTSQYEPRNYPPAFLTPPGIICKNIENAYTTLGVRPIPIIHLDSGLTPHHIKSIKSKKAAERKSPQKCKKKLQKKHQNKHQNLSLNIHQNLPENKKEILTRFLSFFLLQLIMINITNRLSLIVIFSRTRPVYSTLTSFLLF
jgi:hypothetical protein